LLAFLRESPRVETQEDALGAFMARLFVDRIAEKRSLLLQVASSTTDELTMPAAEVDPEADLRSPVAESPRGAVTRSRAMLWLGLAGALMLLVLSAPQVGWRPTWLRSGTIAPATKPLPEAAPEPLGALAAALPPAPVMPTKIRIELRSTPAGAQVLIGGEEAGRTPLVLHEDQREGSLSCELRSPGFRPVTRDLSLHLDQLVDVVLQPEHAPPKRQRVPRNRSQEAPRPDDFHRL
jgi:hypothetical protein